MNIGVDLEKCERVANLISAKIFSPNELAYIKSKNNALQTVAGIYCAKEAYFKAKGTGIVKSEFPKIEVAHDQNGKPYYANDKNAILSISHTVDTAVAVCIIF